MELAENAQKPLQRLSVPVLREYLANEFAKSETSFERLVVFLCFFVGNDFDPYGAGAKPFTFSNRNVDRRKSSLLPSLWLGRGRGLGLLMPPSSSNPAHLPD